MWTQCDFRVGSDCREYSYNLLAAISQGDAAEVHDDGKTLKTDDVAAVAGVVHVPLAHRLKQQQPSAEQQQRRDLDLDRPRSPDLGLLEDSQRRGLQQQAFAVGAKEATVPYHAYFVDLQVGLAQAGSTQKTFGVELDSGSSATAIPSAQCDSCPAEMLGYSPSPDLPSCRPGSDYCPGPLECESADCPSSAFLGHGEVRF